MRQTGWILPAVVTLGAACATPDETTTVDQASSHDDDRSCGWDQWGRAASHDGSACVRGQRPDNTLASFTFDPFVPQESAEAFGDLFVHYQVPLEDDDSVYMMEKTGTYVSCDPPGSGEPFPCGIDTQQTSQIWNEKGFRWHGNHLETAWNFESDWKPFSQVFLWEPMFQPALSGPFIYIPGAGGTVYQVWKHSGVTRQRINPFGTAVDPNIFVVGGITAADDGSIYWNTVRVDPDTFDQRGSLVRARPDGHTKLFSYDDVPGAPAAGDLCYTDFFVDQPPPPMPWPPPDQPDGSPTLPPQFPCGAQRPGANVTPSIGRDGTIYTASTAAFNEFYSYVLALRPDMTVKWAHSLRDVVQDGCGILVPYGTDPNDCREGAAFGVDPITNLPSAVWVDDASSSAPVALPDGGVIYGALSPNNGGRGYLVKFDRHGNFDGTFNFGWDVTPAIYEHDHTYSIIVKDNDYADNGPYNITQLSADLQPEWSFKNTSTQACTRNPDGTITCSDTSSDGETHPDGFEWCVNAPAVDRDGTVYATSEDGNLYAIGQGGVQRSQVFLNISIGAAYTPLSIDRRGRIYALNNGILDVMGR